jgi:hypothetical protein
MQPLLSFKWLTQPGVALHWFNPILPTSPHKRDTSFSWSGYDKVTWLSCLANSFLHVSCIPAPYPYFHSKL